MGLHAPGRRRRACTPAGSAHLWSSPCPPATLALLLPLAAVLMEPPLHVVHIAVEMAPICKVRAGAGRAALAVLCCAEPRPAD